MTDDEREPGERQSSESETEDGGDPLADRLDEVAKDADTDHDPDADPFEAIGEGDGPRHGDPFDTFQDAGESGDGGDAADHGDAADRADPAQGGLPSGIAEEDVGFRDGSAATASGETTERETGDPFTEFDEPTSDPFREGETVFDNAATADVDGDDGVWERMESTDAEAREVPGKRYVDVNKHSYCETCEYFSEPPAISCSHEGTEILEFVDMDTVRVSDCPIVEERKLLEDSE